MWGSETCCKLVHKISLSEPLVLRYQLHILRKLLSGTFPALYSSWMHDSGLGSACWSRFIGRQLCKLQYFLHRLITQTLDYFLRVQNYRYSMTVQLKNLC